MTSSGAKYTVWNCFMCFLAGFLLHFILGNNKIIEGDPTATQTRKHHKQASGDEDQRASHFKRLQDKRAAREALHHKKGSGAPANENDPWVGDCNPGADCHHKYRWNHDLCLGGSASAKRVKWCTTCLKRSNDPAKCISKGPH